MKGEVFLSLVIPVFNEEKRIKKGITHAIIYLSKQSYTWEIIIIDDGSKDKTLKLAKSLLKNYRHSIFTHPKNQGKGAAIRDGMLLAKGNYLVFSDIDFSTPITELPKLIHTLKNCDVAIGVRRHPKSQVLVHQPKLRELLGQVFTLLTNVIATPGIYDVTCGFKGFQKSAAKKIFSAGKINAWAFDAENLFLARKYGFKIVQVPVVWADNSATKVKMMKDGVMAFADLTKIRFFDLLKAYDEKL